MVSESFFQNAILSFHWAEVKIPRRSNDIQECVLKLQLALLYRNKYSNRTGEDNGDAHHKRQIMGREVVIAITEGKLDFGTWEQILYGDFDDRRAKRVLIKIIGE